MVPSFIIININYMTENAAQQSQAEHLNLKVKSQVLYLLTERMEKRFSSKSRTPPN